MRPPLGRRVLARRVVIAALGASALALPLFVGTASAGPSNARWTIAGSRPSWAAQAPDLGAPAASTNIDFNVVLPMRDEAGAEKLALDVSDPNSANYGHYVSAATFDATYGPTSDQISKVQDYLRSSGLTVTGIAPGNRWVSVSATAQQVETAFGVKLRNYQYKSHVVREPATSLTVPQSMKPYVSAIIGIGTEGSLRRPASPVQEPSQVSPQTTANCSNYWRQYLNTFAGKQYPTTNCGYTPKQMRTAYGLQPSVSTGIDGRGIDVAIVDAYANPTMLADSNDYSTSQGEPAFAAGQYTEHTFTPFSEQSACGGEAGWNTEESLDVEAVHAMAPGANVHYVGAANCDAGIDDALNYVVENHVADIVSDSFGSTGEDNLGSELTTEHAIFVAAAAEGIGFYFSSGDDGDNVTLNKTLKAEPDYPASDPYVTGVGGTSLAITSSSSYQFETSWGDDVDPIENGKLKYPTLPGTFEFGAGGGVSALYSQPSYQAGIVPSSLAKGKRVVPDIAADADPATGFLIEYDGDLYTYGGTSLACPLIAGLQAVVSQGRIVPIGFANPALYALNSNAFHDVTVPASTTTMMTPSGNALFTIGHDSTLTATSGYDDSTGRGTPNGLTFVLGERLLSSTTVGSVIHTP